MPTRDEPERPKPHSRVAAFHRRYPTGRIRTRVVRWTRRHVVIQAQVFRALEDRRPATTAFGVWYRDAAPDTNRHSVVDGMLEAVETLAVERALALLDVSAEAEAVWAPAPRTAPTSRAAASAPTRPAAAHPVARVRAVQPSLPPDVADLLALLERATRDLVRPARAARWRAQLLDGHTRPSAARLRAFEGRLRRRLARSEDRAPRR